MNALIPIRHSGGKAAVNARELHAFLEVQTRFNDWIKSRIEDFGFVENQDFTAFTENPVKPETGRPRIEYALSLDMAKELSMLERNSKGRQARQYFIECERQANSAPPQTLPAAPCCRAGRACRAAGRAFGRGRTESRRAGFAGRPPRNHEFHPCRQVSQNQAGRFESAAGVFGLDIQRRQAGSNIPRHLQRLHDSNGRHLAAQRPPLHPSTNHRQRPYQAGRACRHGRKQQ